jgi:hypothetical protein
MFLPKEIAAAWAPQTKCIERQGSQGAQLCETTQAECIPKRPLGRDRDARAESAIGVPARGPNSQIQAMPTARKSGWHGEGLQTVTRDAPVTHQQTSGGIQRP